MGSLQRSAVFFSAGLLFAVIASAGLAATVVTVDLWDKGANQGIKASPPSAPAGVVTFNVSNSSKEIVHEMIVIYLRDPTKPLPYIDNENRVDEEKAGDKGEVSELEPSKSGSLTVTLKPRKYLLICNLPGHYAAGMWTDFEVNEETP